MHAGGRSKTGDVTSEFAAVSLTLEIEHKRKIYKFPFSSTRQMSFGSSRDSNYGAFVAIKGKKVLLYDTISKRLDHLPETKFNHSEGSVVNFNGNVYAISGHNHRSVEIISNDLQSEWSEVAETNHHRRWGASTVCNDCIYTTGAGWSATSSGERYSYANKKWDYIRNMKEERWGHALVALKGKIYAIGGRRKLTHLNLAECYEPLKDTWENIPPMKRKRSGLSAVVLNEEIYAIGGRERFEDRTSVERYNPDTRKWIDAASLIQPRSGHGSCVINGKIYVAGGNEGLNTIEVYDPSNQMWTVEGHFNELNGATCIVAV